MHTEAQFWTLNFQMQIFTTAKNSYFLKRTMITEIFYFTEFKIPTFLKKNINSEGNL